MSQLLRKLAAWPPLDLILLTAALVLFIAAGARALSAGDIGPAPTGQEPLPPPLPARADATPETPDDLLMGVVVNDPFRPDRTAPPERYQPDDRAAGAPATRGATRPRPGPDLRLRGTAISLDERLAVIEGVPGRPGAGVFRPGDSLGDLRLETVAGDSIVLVGPDTTVVLKILRPWKEQ